MKTTQIEVRVRYNETDRMGYLHHSAYVIYFEMARTELLRDHGTTYKWMEDNGIILPVYTIHIDYKQPARYDDLLTVKAILSETPAVRLKMEYEVFTHDGTIIATGHSVNVFADKTTGRPIRPTKELLSVFSSK